MPAEPRVPFPLNTPLACFPSLRCLRYAPLLLFLCLTASAQQLKTHPVPLGEKETASSEACLACHDTLTKPKFVHTAVKEVGCTACHEVRTEGENTTVSLLAQGNELCLVCHEDERTSETIRIHPSTVPFPCTTCHDPHSAEFPAQTRAATNALCLECHAERRVQGDAVQLFKSQAVSAGEFSTIPKLALDRNLRFGHPFLGHPVAGADDPTRKGEKISCLSCHVPHASQQTKLLRGEKSANQICERCHLPETADQEKP